MTNASLEKQYTVLQSEGRKLPVQVRHFLETESFSLHRMLSNQKQNNLKLSAINLKLCFYVVVVSWKNPIDSELSTFPELDFL